MRPHIPSRLPFFAALLTFAAAFAPGDALAWSAEGHRIVARIAEAGLSPAARVEVDRLLEGEADPTLAGIAAWADELRDTDPEAAKASARWHFVNFQGRCAFDAATDCAGNDCVIGAINRNYLLLAQHGRADGERRDALKFLVHFVGDAHQPLHAGLRDDAGGNRHQVNYKGDGSNLHRIWDGTILERRGLKSRAYAAELLARAPLAQDPTLQSQTPALDWALESCRIIEAGDVYPPEGRRVLGDTFLDARLPIVEERLRKAGARLAAMLNHALAPPVAVPGALPGASPAVVPAVDPTPVP
ncbi:MULTISPECIES: S1/P1 nuclease [unclassified Luteimonas]|uniref:S1/P1 nuclease n=1 Tax=unclassified Luteimonas TaxID=2629088 RepID=UPI0016022858|nr:MULTISPECIES: S1/P1 nuclease [unclassified Luteimonas]MBB1473715.1 S1/P1 nuclease [Luteimonas sp. MC1782]MBB6600070.1 S1/P1 nuclease [Luteimonas sp. MC1825]QOC87772.1 S1/P1 nuclease [Luteimonas sp. MC1825]